MIESPWMLLAISALAAVTILFALWLLGLARNNFSYVDIGWSANFAVLAVLYASLAPGYAATQVADRRDVLSAGGRACASALAGPRHSLYIDLSRIIRLESATGPISDGERCQRDGLRRRQEFLGFFLMRSAQERAGPRQRN